MEEEVQEQLRPRVLLVEDNRADARLIEELLREAEAGLDLEWVTRLGEAAQRLNDSEPVIDAVLLDLSLPDSQGFETFASLSSQAPQVPIIMLTGIDDEQLAIQAVRGGAQDYLVKGRVDGELLARAVRYAIERWRSEGALQRSEETLRLAMDASESGVWDLDIATGMVTLSAGCQAMLGFEPVPLTKSLDEALSDGIHPDDYDKRLRALQEVIEGDTELYETEHRLQAKDGSWVSVHAKGRIVERTPQGRPLRLIVTRTNITARKQLRRPPQRTRASSNSSVSSPPHCRRVSSNRCRVSLVFSSA